MNELTVIDWNLYLGNFLRSISGLSPRTMTSYKTGIKCFLDFMKAKKIDKPLPDDIHDFQSHLKTQGYSVFSIGLYLISLKKFFAYLNQPYKGAGQELKVYADIYKMANPKVKRPDRKVHYREMPTDEAIAKLRGSLKNKRSQKAKRDLLMIDLACYGGLRVREIANVKITDLVKDNDKYRLYLLRKGSSSKNASIFIDGDIAERLYGYCEKYRIRGFVFTDIVHEHNGTHLNASTISTIISQYLIDLKLKKDTITAHSLRHHAGTEFYQATKDLYATQQFMGHRNAQTTEIYMHTEGNYEKAGVALAPC